MCSPILIAKLSRTCCSELAPYALLKSSVLRWLQKQDDDEDKSRTAAGIGSSKLDLDAAFICTMISATTLLNVYAELSEFCTTRKRIECG